LIREEVRMKDVESQTTNIGGRTTTYIATFQSKNDTPSEIPMFTKEQREQRKKEIVELKKTMPCWNCGKTGHWSRKCNEEKKTLEKKEETTFVIKGKTH